MHHVEFFVHVYIDVAVLSFLLLCTPITAQLVSHPSLSSLLPSFTLSSLSFILYFSQPAVSLHLLLLSLSLPPLVCLPSSTDGELHQRGEELYLRSVRHRHSSIFNQECICLKGARNVCE